MWLFSSSLSFQAQMYRYWGFFSCQSTQSTPFNLKDRFAVASIWWCSVIEQYYCNPPLAKKIKDWDFKMEWKAVCESNCFSESGVFAIHCSLSESEIWVFNRGITAGMQSCVCFSW